METKLNQKRMKRVRRSCGFNSGIEVEADGSRGGLSLAWKSDIGVTLRSFSKWHIDVLVREGSSQEWRFTGFYGSPYSKDRSYVWNLLRHLSQDCNFPWLVAGDFNEILYSFEKRGGVPREQKRMEAFRDTLEDCQLMDMGYSGVWFTWERGNLPETNIRERLDRGVTNEAWLLLFPMGKVQHPPHSTSDHCPLLLTTDNPPILGGSRSFRFEAWWTMEDSFEGALKEFWDSYSVPLWEKLMRLQIYLKNWADSIRSKKAGLKRRLAKELEFLLAKDRDDETMSRIIDTRIHLNMEIDKEEAYWEQRARANWLQLGDKNTAYFHKCASFRKRTNSITKLVSEDGNEATDGSTVLEIATKYFEDLFASKGIGDSRKVLKGIERVITNEVNESLLAPYREEEVWAALKCMGPTKAPGSDGFPALFFQQYWHIVGKEIVAKAIANRLQNVIGLCIDEVQSAFVPGRLITDNIILAYEILHTFRQK
ncbi:reverse transcriptase [Gossypium australe]|uniref:Reverse transcriptase n=1 Tax=Gossypium australe TaxID=47621 RepID=A0A5B6X664_9ROSI|nr:reverse transcriptase [Gossypium australe]